MQSKSIDGIHFIYDPAEATTAEVIAGAAERALPLIHESWGLVKPPDCRIYVMTSWWRFYVQSSHLAWRIFLVLLFPLWGSRARRMWPYSAAWTQNYGTRVSVGIKTPRLLLVSDKSIGRLLFAEEKDMNKKLQQLTCHELTHACAAKLRLPAWLNEGLAMVTVDRMVGVRTIREDTLELLSKVKLNGRPPGYRQLSRMNAEMIASYTALGYWLVRYLEEVRPGLLKQIFNATPISSRVEYKIVAELGIESAGFWANIHEIIIAHFERT